MQQTNVYLIGVEGRLDESWAIWFEGMHIRTLAGPPVTTALVGSVRDQAELFGYLCKLRDLHLTLVEFHRLSEAEVAAYDFGSVLNHKL